MLAAGSELGMTAAEIAALTLRHFRAYHKVFQAREERADRRAALVACILANIHRDSDKRPEPFSVEDFMPGGQKGPEVAEPPPDAPYEERLRYVMTIRGNRQSSTIQQTVIRAKAEALQKQRRAQ